MLRQLELLSLFPAPAAGGNCWRRLRAASPPGPGGSARAGGYSLRAQGRDRSFEVGIGASEGGGEASALNCWTPMSLYKSVVYCKHGVK